MNINHGILLSTLLLGVSINSSHAAVISEVCTNQTDTNGEVFSYSCSTQTSYTLQGTASIWDADAGALAGVFPVFATLTQDIQYTEDMSGSNAGETRSLLNITFGGEMMGSASSIEYSMSRVDFLLDGGYTFGVPTESLTNTAYSITSPTDWLINADGINASLFTLDGDGDGINGVVLAASGFPGLIVDVQLSAVPLPASVWLFGSGLIGLVGLMRRKRG